MSIIRKLLLLITILIFLFILWNLIIIRINIKKTFQNNGYKEPFSATSLIKSITSTNEAKELDNVENSSLINIQNANKNMNDLPLKELCIKASFNSTFSGTYHSLDMLKYVINRGVRYLDFEVFYYSEDDIKYSTIVASSIDPNYTIFNCENYLLLDEVLTTAVSNAFTSPCPNYKDPLFINLRIKTKTKDSSTKQFYQDVAKSIDQNIKQKLYTDPKNIFYTSEGKNGLSYTAIPITSDISFSSIKNSVIISIDQTLFPNYMNYTSCSGDLCYDLTKYTNIQNGSLDMNLLLYSLVIPKTQLQINNTDSKIPQTNVKTITCVNPDSTYLLNTSNKNPDYSDYILKYGGCQIVPYRFYQNDSALAEYEDFFNNEFTAFVPLSNAISYYTKKYQ